MTGVMIRRKLCSMPAFERGFRRFFLGVTSTVLDAFFSCVGEWSGRDSGPLSQASGSRPFVVSCEIRSVFVSLHVSEPARELAFWFL